MEEHEVFDGVAEVGLQVYWFPHARVDGGTNPRVGFVNQGWDKGVVDLSVLPPQDGAVECIDHVYHISDRRLRDPFGKVSPGGMERGCWEFTPFSKAMMELMSPSKKQPKATAKA